MWKWHVKERRLILKKLRNGDMNRDAALTEVFLNLGVSIKKLKFEILWQYVRRNSHCYSCWLEIWNFTKNEPIHSYFWGLEFSFWLFSRTFRNTSVWALPLMQLSSLTFFDWFEHFSSLLRLCHKQPLKAVLQNRCYGNFRHAIVNYLNSSQNIWKSERASRLQLY